MSFDMASYLMGYKKGENAGAGEVIIEGGITCTDPSNDGNVVIEEN